MPVAVVLVVRVLVVVAEPVVALEEVLEDEVEDEVEEDEDEDEDELWAEPVTLNCSD